MKRFIGLIFLLASSVYAVPDPTGTSGTFTDGQTITISGSGFGANGPTLVLYDRFEGGTVGSTVTTGGSSTADFGQWASVTSSTCPPKYSNVEAMYGSQSIVSASDCGTNGGELYARVSLSSATKVFWCQDWKTVGDWHGYTNGSSGVNVKFGWLTFNNDTTDTDFYYAYLNSTINSPPNSYLFDGNDGAVTSTFLMNATTTTAASGSRAGWKQNCAWVEGDGNGNVQFWQVVSTGTVRRQLATTETAPTILGDPTVQHTYWTDQRFPGFLRSDVDGTISLFYQDNIYVSTGNTSAAAHIWMMDQPTLFASTKWVLWEPLTWSDTSITAKYRPGDFSYGQTAYLYVCDADFSCNENGLEVLLGTPTGGASSSSSFTGDGTFRGNQNVKKTLLNK